MVIQNGEWTWPEILDIEHREITHVLPPVTAMDEISWDSSTRQFTIDEAARLFQPPGPRVVFGILCLRAPFELLVTVLYCG
ncbi:UNVERIFIED_CONTAM: hypothetical protein Slati_0887900 [Sesamum latifolium]|uniref:Uncharacterized protein n=1 Tax=Sesamum latifolium TaxID=2727402 RepID=A0AAW2XMY8_9LAMI